MATLKSFCTFIADLFREIKDCFSSTQLGNFMIEQVGEKSIELFQDTNSGVIHYVLDFDDVTVRTVTGLNLDEVSNLVSVNGTLVKDKSSVCCGLLFHSFAGLYDRDVPCASSEILKEFFKGYLLNFLAVRM